MMTASEKIDILVVEDEEPIRRGLCDVLAYHGYTPTGVDNGEDGLREGLSNQFDLILLDIMLPGLSGFEVCEAIRAKNPHQLIIMLTARGSEEDVLTGFRVGADDYVTKPFSVAEIMARVDALLRRSGRARREEQVPFDFSQWRVDPANLEAVKGEEKVELTAREISILALFLREQGRIVSRRMLLQEIWEMPDPDRIETRTVDMQLAKLRKKLHHEEDQLIETVRGAGYRFVG
jgi:DNA-binding response OmpR family regulator